MRAVEERKRRRNGDPGELLACISIDRISGEITLVIFLEYSSIRIGI
jgi:hypothetical protein